MSLFAAFVLGFLSLNSDRLADQDAKVQIHLLVQSFVKSAREGGDLSAFLSPKTPPAVAAKEIELARKPYLEFHVAAYRPETDIVLQGKDRAILHTYVDWKAPHEEAQMDGAMRFEMVAGRWYFTDFEILRFPWVTVIVMTSLGGLSATFSLVLILHWRRQSVRGGLKRTLWIIVLVFPFGWIPYLLIKPWKSNNTQNQESVGAVQPLQ